MNTGAATPATIAPPGGRKHSNNESVARVVSRFDAIATVYRGRPRHTGNATESNATNNSGRNSHRHYYSENNQSSHRLPTHQHRGNDVVPRRRTPSPHNQCHHHTPSNRKRSRSNASHPSTKEVSDINDQRNSLPTTRPRKPTEQSDHTTDQQRQATHAPRSYYNPKTRVLTWPSSPFHPIPLHVEQSAESVLVRWPQSERGMLRTQPDFRRQQIQLWCSRNPGVTWEQALSLRRHLLKHYHPYKTMEQLELGSDADIRESARLFEVAIAEWLTRNAVPFISEAEQRLHRNRHDGTPDFLFDPPITMMRHHRSHGPRPSRPQRIHWLEVKMFYGASMVPFDSNTSAVGCLMRTVRKYLSSFGPGAIVFLYGYGAQLEASIQSLGPVLVLDGRVQAKDAWDLSALLDYQTTWCRDPDGTLVF
jgi:hypothetical protein